MMPSNFHTHTTFCDGKDTPEELVLAAIAAGCPEIGLSGHGHTAFDESWCMSVDGTEKYIRTVRELQKKYRDKIAVRLGVEQDFYSDIPADRFEYAIGSVHYVYRNGKYLPIDESAAALRRAVAEEYGGDCYALAEDYFATVGQVYEKTGCRIIGHFDLITKFNEQDRLFDTEHPRYRAAVAGALEKLLKTDCVFELNFGAILRGYRTAPYPAPDIQQVIRAAGKTILPTSDCHDKAHLLFGLL